MRCALPTITTSRLSSRSRVLAAETLPIYIRLDGAHELFYRRADVAFEKIAEHLVRKSGGGGPRNGVALHTPAVS
jgi:hypothetical protein